MEPNNELTSLALLDTCGLKVETNGVISDWQDRPAQDPRPLNRNYGQRAGRHAFTLEDDRVLTQWCTAAQAEGVHGPQVFQQLETVRPAHSWQAYQTRWRRKLKQTPRLEDSTDCPFPGLDYSDEAESLAGIHQTQAELDEGLNSWPNQMSILGREPRSAQIEVVLAQDEDSAYGDYRVEIDRVLLANLGLDDHDDLRHLLRQPWLQTVYTEFITGNRSNSLLLNPTIAPHNTLLGRSQYVWKLNRAGHYLSSPSEAPLRYTAECPNTAAFTEDDFDVRFLVRAVTMGAAPGQIWHQEQREHGWQRPCKKALNLLMWFRWLHKETRGKGREMMRLKEKRDEWLQFLHDQNPGPVMPMGGPSQPTDLHHLPENPEQLINGVVAAFVDQNEPPNTMTTGQILGREGRLISDDARNLYLRIRHAVLGSWGVDAQHASTCLLVPQIWASTSPVSLLETPEAWPIDEMATNRMTTSIASYNHLWARWTAWFMDWPRSVDDLRAFLPGAGTGSRMHGSHLCHHGLCILPRHIVYEDMETNLSRNSCAYKARVLRQYGARIPQYCLNPNHQPSCLLQLAAVTSFEACAVQFNVLRLAKNLPLTISMAVPSHHPAEYHSFFEGPYPSTEHPNLGLTREDAVRLVADKVTRQVRGFHWICPFCSYHRDFQQITSFWAHLSPEHDDCSEDEILREVVRSAQANKTWAETRFYDYEHVNPVTWQKILQALDPSFSWEVFRGWRLPRTKLYAGRARARSPEAHSEQRQSA